MGGVALLHVSREKQEVVKNRILENCTIVLFEPRNAGNIGSTARAMKNMGLRRLKLVCPTSLDAECERMAVGAVDVVENAAHFDSLDEALQEEQVIIGTTSSRGRRARRKIYYPREIVPRIWHYARRQRVAILFGPERRGLSQDQLVGCQYLVMIPGNPSFPTLNLAQSVLVLSYELFSFEGGTVGEPSPRLASHRERERMFKHMKKVLLEIGFLDPNNPDHIMRSIRRFLGQADLSSRDIKIVRGMMSQMGWYSTRDTAKKHGNFPADSETND